MAILVVGAGFSGAVYAHQRAQAGCTVNVIDQRYHLGGNSYDEKYCGIRVHKYGPHLFHTSNHRVVEWLSRFTGWFPYIHRVKARLPDERLVPVPVNSETVKAVMGHGPEKLPNDPNSETTAKDAKTWLESQIGEQLTDLFFRWYTQRTWGLSLSEISADVVKRVRVRMDDEDRYFPQDTFQPTFPK